MVSDQTSLISDRHADRIGAPHSPCRNGIFQTLSVATQRSIARDIIDRAGAEHAPLLPPYLISCPSPCALLVLSTYAFRAFD
jgi:hypothetical protein